MRITKEKNLQMISRLDEFRTLMRSLGRIGNLRNGSGLEEAFEEVYSKDVIKHSLSGRTGHTYWASVL